jgi:hypothetical protein
VLNPNQKKTSLYSDKNKINTITSGSMPVCAHEIIFAIGIWFFNFAVWFEQRIRAAAPSLRPVYQDKLTI